MIHPGTQCSNDETALEITLFNSLKDTTPSSRRLSWAQLAEDLVTHRERAEKDGPGWSANVYREAATRGKDGVEWVTALVLDVDHEEPLWSLLDGLEYAAHTTWKHHASDDHEDCKGRSDCPHWRIVVPLAWPVPTADWDTFRSRARFWLCPNADQSAKDAPRFFWLPTAQPNVARDSKRQHGRWLDPDELRPIPDEEPKRRVMPRSDGVGRGASGDGNGERPGDRFEREADWCRDILPDWKPVGIHGDNLMLRRPGSTNPYGATISKRGAGVLYMFSSNAAPLQPNTWYSKFGAYTTLRHGGDFTRAAAQLAEQYPQREQPPPDLSSGDAQDRPSVRSNSWADDPSGDAIARLSAAFSTLIDGPADGTVGAFYSRSAGQRALAAAAATPASSTGATGGGPGSQADELVRIGLATELFHDAMGDTYAQMKVDGHTETWSTRSKGFERWLVRVFYTANQKPPARQSVRAALDVLEAEAQFNGPCRTVHLRVAPSPDGGIVIDLGDPAWRCVIVTPDGWRIEDAHPVHFRRSRGMLALPAPAPGGSLDELRRFVNVRDDAEWALSKAWLRAVLRDRGPYPVLALRGEQGTAKSTAARIFRALTDPAKPDLRADPRNGHDIMIAAKSSWLVIFDNISQVQPWLSDCLARLATGGGFGTRMLYSDDEEMLFESQRPVALTGIDNFIERGDLLDRAIQVTLEPIAERERRSERTLWADFDAARPRLFGALLDDLVGALRELPNAPTANLSRMADFHQWAWAAERGRDEPEVFETAYRGARASAHEQAIDSSIVGPALRVVLEAGPFEGTAGELLERLSTTASEPTKRSKAWPKTPRAVSAELRRLAPALRHLGWDVVFPDRLEGRQRRRVLRIIASPERLQDRSHRSHRSPPEREGERLASEGERSTGAQDENRSPPDQEQVSDASDVSGAAAVSARPLAGDPKRVAADPPGATTEVAVAPPDEAIARVAVDLDFLTFSHPLRLDPAGPLVHAERLLTEHPELAELDNVARLAALTSILDEASA